MGDEPFGVLEAKNLSNLRVVDLKRELEKRGLPKSGSKKDLVKRLKQKLELEKLFEAAGSGVGVEPRLQLDEATEQNEFVRQYLQNQQKLYAQQKGIIEKQGKDGEEDDECEEDEESDSGAKGHESDVSENVGVAIKSTCDSSTYESTEEEETKPDENTGTSSVGTSEEKMEKKENPAVLDCAEQSPSKVDYSEVLKSESDQESSGSGKPDSTALSFEPKVEISDQDSSSQPSLVTLIIQELESPEEEMHPKKSKLKKHNDKLQEAISTPEADNRNVNAVAKTNNGANTTENCANRTCVDQTDYESEPLSLIKNAEKSTELKDTVENSSSVQIVPVEEQVKNVEYEKDCALDLVCQDSMKKSEDLESTEPDDSYSTDERCLKDTSGNKETGKIHSENVDEEINQTAENNVIVHAQPDKSGADHITEEKQVETPSKDNSSIEKEEMDVDQEESNKISKIRVRDQQSDESSDTEDGESKTDDEGKKPIRADHNSSSFQKDKSLSIPLMSGDSWKHAASDSSSDSDSSGGDSRRKHKSYKSSKREELFSSSSRKNVIDVSKSVDNVKSKEKIEEVGYTPRRLKIKRSAFVPAESSVSEDKVFKKAKSPIISPEKSKREKSPIISPDKARKEKSRASSEDKPSRKEKVTEVAESKPVKKEKLQRSLSSRDSSFKSTKDENQSRAKAEPKKRSAEDIEPDDPIPAKVTYRKLNIPFKKNEDKEQDSREHVSDKKRLWRSFGSKSAANISTDSLKTIIPDFKVVCGPSLNEAEEMPSPKVASDAPSFSNKSRSNSYTEESGEKMEVEEGVGPENLKMVEKDSRKEGMESHRRTVLPKKPVSRSLFIQNLVRPFTLVQLKEMLKRTGKLVEEDFWIDKIKSKCFVTYETTDQAEETKEALNGTRWPSSNPKILVVDFVTAEEMENHKKMVEQSKPTVSMQDRLENQAANSPLDARRKRDIEDPFQEREQRPRQNITYIREWDKDKIIQEESPDKEKPLLHPKDKSRSEKKKDKKDGKRKQEDDTPAKLLDDLFHKTKTTPCIYWLPLTEEQSKEKEEQRRQRRLERERTRKQEEEEEQRRTRRRRESRSPVRRR